MEDLAVVPGVLQLTDHKRSFTMKQTCFKKKKQNWSVLLDARIKSQLCHFLIVLCGLKRVVSSL